VIKSIISYNVNGIRAAARKGLWEWMASVDPDVVCFQETKAHEADILKEVKVPAGYEAYWYSAEKKGYSGVGILTKESPVHVERGMGVERYDAEGRVLRLDFKEFSVISLYLPSGSGGEVRQQFKEEFMAEFLEYIKELRKTVPRLIISGDYNCCHTEIDIHNPVTNKNSSGFLPHERQWVSDFLAAGFTDSFRKFHPEPHQYTWWTYRAGARGKNKGWRIDYHLTDQSLDEQLIDHKIHTDAMHSDHAPLELIMEV